MIREAFWYKVHRKGPGGEKWETHGPFSTPEERDKAINRRVVKNRIVRGKSYVTMGMVAWDDDKEPVNEECKDADQGEGS